MQCLIVVSKGSFVIGQLCESLHHHWSGCIRHGFQANGLLDLEIGLLFFVPWELLCVTISFSWIIIMILFSLAYKKTRTQKVTKGETRQKD